MQSYNDHDPATGAILDSIRRVVQALRLSSRQAEHDVGISGAQLFVLRKLAEADGPLTLGDLATRTLTHPSSVSTVVSRLVARRFVLRNVALDDRRRVEVKLSAKGRTFLEKDSPVTAQEQLTRAIINLDKERRLTLAELLSQIITEAGFGSDEPTMFFEERSPRDPRRPASGDARL